MSWGQRPCRGTAAADPPDPAAVNPAETTAAAEAYVVQSHLAVTETPVLYAAYQSSSVKVHLERRAHPLEVLMLLLSRRLPACRHWSLTVGWNLLLTSSLALLAAARMQMHEPARIALAIQGAALLNVVHVTGIGVQCTAPKGNWQLQRAPQQAPAAEIPILCCPFLPGLQRRHSMSRIHPALPESHLQPVRLWYGLLPAVVA